MSLTALALIANVIVTFVVSAGLFRDAPRMATVYGAASPARQILACIYLTIGLVSLYALIQLGLGAGETARLVAITLFPLQIIYKLMTAFAVGPRNPVVLANLAISVLLGAALLFG